MFLIALFGVVLTIAAIVLAIFPRLLFSKPQKVGGDIAIRLGFVVLAMILFRLSAPHAANGLLFKLGVLGMSIWVPLVVGAASTLAFCAHMASNRRSYSVEPGELVVGFGGAALTIFATFFFYTGQQVATARAYSFQGRKAIVEVQPDKLRFTPLQVAHRSMIDAFNSSEFQVQLGHTDIIDVNGGIGAVSVVSPDGLLNAFQVENDGFMVWDDNPNTPEDQRLTRVKQPQTIGEDMLWTDNLRRHLYHTDFASDYPEILYLQLEEGNPRSLTALAPKVKYRWEFPFYWVPYWAGVTLVHQDGRLEELTAEQAKTDERLTGKKLYPSDLFREIVDAQRYVHGRMAGLFKSKDKIQIPTLPGNNQMPFFTRAADGNDYYVVATEPDGESFALFKMFYADAHTGELSVYTYNGKPVVGPEVAIGYVKLIPGYKWVQDQGEAGRTGDFQPIEPIYTTRDGRLYWKYTITSLRFRGIAFTAVVDPETKDVYTFDTRAQLSSWLNGQDKAPRIRGGSGGSTGSKPIASTPSKPPVTVDGGADKNELEQIRLLLVEATRRLDELQKK